MNSLRRWLLALSFLLVLPAHAGNLLMVRSTRDFPETMLALQEAIKAEGYTLSRVQRVDIGLIESGFPTDKYRLVFFGRPDEVRALTDEHPQFIPFLPLGMTIFAEGADTLVVTADPAMFLDLADTPTVRSVVERWQRDVHTILDRVVAAP